MEYAIAIFVGLWISAAGLLSYKQISSDFAQFYKEDSVRKEKHAE